MVTYAMAARAGLASVNTLLEPLFAAADKTHWVMSFNLVMVTIQVAAIFVAAPFGLFALAWSQAGVVLLGSILALMLMRWKAQVAIGGAVRGYVMGLLLAGIYGVSLWQLSDWLLPQTGLLGIALLAAGLFMATVLGLLFLVIGWRLRVFTLDVFQG